MQTLRVKRVYDPPEAGDGARFLVERLWPRGIRKDALSMAAWLKEVAPSAGLRRWYAHDPVRWETFRQRYHDELDDHPEVLEPLWQTLATGPVTLLFSARSRTQNSAMALADYLRERATFAWGRNFSGPSDGSS